MGCIETAHPDLDALTLAGSTATGAYLRTALSGRNVRLQTETGGKNASVELANDSRYGLSAAVFTTRLRLANEFIDLAEAGQVAVNLPTSGWDVHHPFSGSRDSGSAFKEQGARGRRFYTRLKTAAVRYAW